MEYVILVILIFMSGLFRLGNRTVQYWKSCAHSIESVRNANGSAHRQIEHPRNLLIAVLLGNEVTNVALSVVTAGITSRFLDGYSLLEQALLSAAIVIPILLIFGEITPKTLASKRPELLGRFVVRLIYWFLTLVKPIVWFLRKTTQIIVNRLGGVLTNRIQSTNTSTKMSFVPSLMWVHGKVSRLKKER